MGGATVEGQVHVSIDGGTFETKRKSRSALNLERISVTLIGVERCKGRRDIFRALTTDLIDETHPPPINMAPGPGFGSSWEVVASDTTLPFRLDLPVIMGPPPYTSKKVGIRYWLSALLEFKAGAKRQVVRQSREIMVLTVHDRMSLLVIAWSYGD